MASLADGLFPSAIAGPCCCRGPHDTVSKNQALGETTPAPSRCADYPHPHPHSTLQYPHPHPRGASTTHTRTLAVPLLPTPAPSPCLYYPPRHLRGASITHPRTLAGHLLPGQGRGGSTTKPKDRCFLPSQAPEQRKLSSREPLKQG